MIIFGNVLNQHSFFLITLIEITFDSFCRFCHFMQARPMPSCGVCVCPSVTFVNSIKTNKDIFKSFSPPVAKPL